MIVLTLSILVFIILNGIAFRFIKHPFRTMLVFNAACALLALLLGDKDLGPIVVPGWFTAMALFVLGMFISVIFALGARSRQNPKENPPTNKKLAS